MLTNETITRLAQRDTELRREFRPVVSDSTGVSLLRHAKAVLDGQAEAAKAERSLCDEVRERLQRERAAR